MNNLKLDINSISEDIIENIINKGDILNEKFNNIYIYHINKLIQNNKNICLYRLLRELSTNPWPILCFIILGKNKKFLSRKKYEDSIFPCFVKNLISKNFMLLFKKKVYKTAIKYNNYSALSILYHFDPRKEKRIFRDIYLILKSPEERKKFTHDIENRPSTLFPLHEILSLLKKYHPLTPQEIKNTFFNLIKCNDDVGLKNAIEKYQIYLSKQEIREKYGRSEYIIIDALEYFISPQLFDILMDQILLENPKITEKDLEIDDYLYKAISKNNLILADHIIKKFPDHTYHLLFTWLYNNDDNPLTPRNLNFIFNRLHQLKIYNDNYNDFFYIYNGILEREDASILKKVFRHCIYDNRFILKLLLLYQKKKPLSPYQLNKLVLHEKHKLIIDRKMYNYVICKGNDELLNLLYCYDLRDKVEVLNDIFYSFHINMNCALVTKIKEKTIQFPWITDIMLHQLECCESIRETIFNLIQEGNVFKLKQYLLDQQISFKELTKFNPENTNDFLCSAIDQHYPSMNMVLFIMKCYFNLNYFVWIKNNDQEDKNKKKRNNNKDKYKSPLSCALEHHHFSIAKLLINSGADLNYFCNYTTVVDVLYHDHHLSNRNINFLLNHGYKIDSYLISLLIKYNKKNDNSIIVISFYNIDSESEEDDYDYDKSNDSNNNSDDDIANADNILDIILYNYIFDNQFIMEFLFNYKNKRPLSDKELNHRIEEETNKIAKDAKHYYKKAIESYDNKSIEALMKYDKVSLKDMKLLYQLILTANRVNNLFFIEKIINSSHVDLNQFVVKDFYSFSDFIKYIHPLEDQMDTINNKINFYFNENEEEEKKKKEDDIISESDYVDSSSYYSSGSCYESGNGNGTYMLFKHLIHNNEINYNINHYEEVLLIVIDKFISELMVFITKSLEHPTFSFEKYKFENILYHLLKVPYPMVITVFSNLFIEKAISHKTFDYKRINMKKCINYLLTCRYDPEFQIFKKFINELTMKCEGFNSNNSLKNKIIKWINQYDNIE